MNNLNNLKDQPIGRHQVIRALRDLMPHRRRSSGSNAQMA